jgi:peptide-methionine (S)-S-oxide reductase
LRNFSTLGPEHGELANAMIRQMAQDKLFSAPITTEVAPLSNYSTAEAYHQDYYERKGTQPYCHSYTKRF